MNALWPRFLKVTYRKEPISSFLMTMGLVNAAIGGFDHSSSLVIFGVGTVGLALVLRWWMIQRNRPQVIPEPIPQQPQRYLTGQSSSQLPNLSVQRKHR